MYTYEDILYNFSDNNLMHCIEMLKKNNFPENKIAGDNYELNDAMFYVFNGKELMKNYIDELLFELLEKKEMSKEKIEKHAKQFIDYRFKNGVYLPVLYSIKNLLMHKGKQISKIEKYDIGITIKSFFVNPDYECEYCGDYVERFETFIPKLITSECISDKILIKEKGLNSKEKKIYENLLTWFRQSFYILLENYLQFCVANKKN